MEHSQRRAGFVTAKKTVPEFLLLPKRRIRKYAKTSLGGFRFPFANIKRPNCQVVGKGDWHYENYRNYFWGRRYGGSWDALLGVFLWYSMERVLAWKPQSVNGLHF